MHRAGKSLLDHNSRHTACPGGAARSWFDGRSGGGGWRRWCSSSRSSTVARSSSSLSTSYPCWRRAGAAAHPQRCRRQGNGRRVGPAGAGRCGVRGRRRGPGARAEEPRFAPGRPEPASLLPGRLSSCPCPPVPPGERRGPGPEVLPASLVPGGTLAPLSSRVSVLLGTPHTQEMTHSENRRCASFTCGSSERFLKKELLQKHPQSVFDCPQQWEICKFSNCT